MTRETFLSAYYNWCRDQVRIEVAADFPALRAVRGSSASMSVAAFLRAASASREHLALGLLARWHQHEPDPDQLSLMREFDGTRFGVFAESRGAAPPDRRLLRRLLREKGPQLLGEQLPGKGSVELRFGLKHADAQLVTFIDTGGKTRQFDYVQTLNLKNESSPLAEAPCSVMAWHGLQAATTWDLLSAGEEEAAVDQFLVFCRRFIEALPALLAKP